MALRTVGARLTLEISNYMANLGKAKVGTKDFFAELDKAARAGKLDAVADQAGRMGLALAAGFLVAVNAAAKFEKQMSAVGAVSNASAQDLERLRKAALGAGRDTTFSATEAAKAEEELAKAGISTANILGGALAGSLSLAAAGQLDLAEAADISAKTMNIFGLKGGDVSHIADVLAASANKSATDVHQLGEAMKMGGLAADAAGMKLEETVGTLSAFADRALVGSDAGTSLKTMLMMLQSPTDKAAGEMRRLGINVYDAQGNFIGATKLAGVLQRQLSGLTQEERNAAMATIFGADAMRAANVLFEVGEKGLQDYTKAVNDQGAASRTAAQMTDNLYGDVERLNGSLQNLAIESGGGVSTGLRGLTQAATALLDTINGIHPAITGSLLGLAGLTGAAMLAFSAWAKLSTGVSKALEQLAEVGPRSAKVAGHLQTMTKHAGRAAAAFAALEVVNTVAAAFAPAAADASKLAASLDALANSGEKAGELTRLFGPNLKQLDHDLRMVRNSGGLTAALKGTALEPGFMKLFDFSLQSTTDRVKGLDDALAQMQSGGHGREAAASFELIKKQAADAGVSVEQLKLIFPAYTAAIDASAKATDGVSASQKIALDRTNALTGGLSEAVREAGSLVAVFDRLNKGALDWAHAENDLEAAVDDANDAIRKNGKTAIEHGTVLDASTKKGRENRAGLLDIAEATRTAIEARYNDTQSLTEANKVYEEGRQAFIRSATAAGLTKKAADELADSWLKMPEVKEIKVKVSPTFGVFTLKIRQEMERSAYRAGERANRWGGAYEHAAHGTLREATTYSAVNPGRYMIAEPETQGEAFVPKSGDYGRSMSILGQAAGWYGASVVPGGTGAWQSGASSTHTVIHEHRHTLNIRSDELMTGIRKEIQLRGGSAQNVTGSRRT